MSHEARPITSAQFASALTDLPVENLYAKAFELRNSIAHLERSNAQLQEYSDSIASDTSIPEEARTNGDKDCLEAIRENVVVINRQKDRIGLLKSEVERRGGRWHEAGVEDNEGKTNGAMNGDVGLQSTPQTTAPGGRLDDDELSRRIAERLGEDEEDGMHL